MEKIDPELAKSPLHLPAGDDPGQEAKVFRALTPPRRPSTARRVQKVIGALTARTARAAERDGRPAARRRHQGVRRPSRRSTTLDLDRPAGLVLRPARPVGLRQDDDAADGRRARAADRGPGPDRRHRHHRRRGPTSDRSTRSSRATRCSRTSTSSTTSPSACGAAAPRTRRSKAAARRSSWCSSATSPRRKPAQLSGGQQQRVALARALVNRPEVLLLDEPLGALDLKLRRQMQVELKRIQTEVGLTFIHVTHDQEEAMTMADTIAVMNAGPHRAARRPRPSSTTLPRTTFVANFLGQSNLRARHGRPPTTATSSRSRTRGRHGGRARGPRAPPARGDVAGRRAARRRSAWHARTARRRPTTTT